MTWRRALNIRSLLLFAGTASLTAFAEPDNFKSDNLSEKPAGGFVRVDFSKENGPVKPMNAVNNGPEGNGGTFRRGNAPEFRAANIPFARTHDSSEYIVYGGDHVVDVTAVFPRFEADENDPANYDFAVTDAYMNRIRSVGTEPFYRLGQRIEHAARRYNIFPPADYLKWARICEHIIRHYNEGWSKGFHHRIRYWEIWNEPDLDCDSKTQPHTWGGTPEQFFAFYAVAAKYLKGRFPDLRIGGPAIAGSLKWGEDFLRYQQAQGTPMDFFSWHIYAREPNAITQKARNFRELMTKYGYGSSESILNEWNYIKGWRENYYYSARTIGEQKGAAFVAATMSACQKAPVDMLMYYNAQPTVIFNGLFDGIGLQPLKGYYAMYSWGKLLRLGTAVDSSADASDLYVTAACNKKDRYAIFLARYSDDDNVSTPKPIRVKVMGASLPDEVYAHMTDETRMHTEMPIEKAEDGLKLVLPPRSFALVEFRSMEEKK